MELGATGEQTHGDWKYLHDLVNRRHRRYPLPSQLNFLQGATTTGRETCAFSSLKPACHYIYVEINT